MLSIQSMLLALGAAIAVNTVSADPQRSLSSLPVYSVPSFDYTSLTEGSSPQRLLAALQSDGIIALKNIPNYANLREDFYRRAAECALKGHDKPTEETPYVSKKSFSDGTQRYTISANAGQELADASANSYTDCPGYQQRYLAFSQALEHAVNTFGATLDKTAFTASDGHKTISSRQLVSEAVRLDHFHAYEAAASAAPSDAETHRRLELSLPLHEDHGLFIAMSAPKFFEVDADGRHLVERELAEDASGLVIQTPSGERVRPVLKADEVVLMMGTGASRWLHTSHALPAVLHGMKMPEPMVASSEAGRRSLRAWFGKMTLLPAYQRMLASNAAFEAHVNATTRFLLTSQESDLKTVGCATGRHLQASNDACTFRTCTLKSGATAPEEPCATICNRKGHAASDAPDCEAKCTCTDSASPAERCWMLCVTNLPSSACPIDSQTCKGQKVECPAGPAPAPGTTAPAPAPGPTPGPAPGPTPGPGPAPTPAPGPGPGPAPAPAPGPGPGPAPGPTTTPPTNAPSSSSSPPGSATTAPVSTTTAKPDSSSTPSSTDATGSTTGSVGGPNTPADPQVGSTTTAPGSTPSPTVAPKSSGSVVLISSAVATIAAMATSLLL